MHIFWRNIPIHIMFSVLFVYMCVCLWILKTVNAYLYCLSFYNLYCWFLFFFSFLFLVGLSKYNFPSACRRAHEQHSTVRRVHSHTNIHTLYSTCALVLVYVSESNLQYNIFICLIWCSLCGDHQILIIPFASGAVCLNYRKAYLIIKEIRLW